VAVFWLEVLVAVAALVGLVFVVTSRMHVLDDEPTDARDSGLPRDRLLRSDDVPRLKFRMAWRGYRFSDVDDAMDAVHAALKAAETKPEETTRAAPPPPSWSRYPTRASDADLAEQPPAAAETQSLSELEAASEPDAQTDGP
jgi:DivIVA domain-containing protein